MLFRSVSQSRYEPGVVKICKPPFTAIDGIIPFAFLVLCDVDNDGIRGFPPAIPYKTLQKSIQLIQENGGKPLLMQIRIPRNYGAAYIAKLEAIYPQLAEETKTPLLPFFLEPIVTQPALMMNDGIHPTAEAQPLIRNMMAPLLRQHIEPKEKTQ